MKVKYKDDHCCIIKFDETKDELRQLGWLGDEDEARIFELIDGSEIRIFKNNGESYVLHEDSKDPMVAMKASKLLSFYHSEFIA